MRVSTYSLHRFSAFLLVIAIAVLLHTRFGAPAELFFAVPVVGTFFLGFTELIFATLLGATLIDMQAAFGPEFFIILLLPVLIRLVQRVYPFEGWFGMLVTLLTSFMALYSASVFFSLWRHGGAYAALFIESAFPAILFGMSVFLLFDYSYKGR